MMTTSIFVTRANAYADHLRDYQLLLNDKEIGRIAQGETRIFNIPPGTHKLRLKIDWCGSNFIEFNITDGKCCHFECGSNLTEIKLLFSLFYVIFARNQYLWLRSRP